ncbi:hypothetical protein [Deinococcus sp. PESE-13]
MRKGVRWPPDFCISELRSAAHFFVAGFVRFGCFPVAGFVRFPLPVSCVSQEIAVAGFVRFRKFLRAFVAGFVRFPLPVSCSFYGSSVAGFVRFGRFPIAGFVRFPLPVSCVSQKNAVHNATFALPLLHCILLFF